MGATDHDVGDAVKPAARFSEPLKMMPILFVSCTILGLYLSYLVWHLLPMLQIGERPEHVDGNLRQVGWWQVFWFHLITFMVVLCYVRAIFTEPGGIPDGDDWDLNASKTPAYVAQEHKQDNERRKCKWCRKFKPDRCHHCRICKKCVLRMDHHCPWIYNCVGFRNYKYFFLLLFYAAIDLNLIIWTMASDVYRAFTEQHDFVDMFAVLFGETIACFLGILITLFFCFHCLLMINAMTTIEFCERKMPKVDADGQDGFVLKSLYDSGIHENMKNVLGPNPLFWLVPFGQPPGDGLTYITEPPFLTRDPEAGRGFRRSKHAKYSKRAYNSPSYGTWNDSYSQLEPQPWK